MEVSAFNGILMVLTFIVGYIFITIEHYTKINKATVAILMAIICWIIEFADGFADIEAHLKFLDAHLSDVFQVIFFLLGALAVVEIINQHKGFSIISRAILVTSKKRLLWVIALITFFMSAVLDNLTTTIVMVSLLKKLIDEGQERWLIGSGVVIAANAGGAWTPIGDVTTTMLWIGDRLSTGHIITQLFLPSLVCLLVATFLISLKLKGQFSSEHIHHREEKLEPLGGLVLFLGVSLLVFVPIFKTLTGLPPFMGILLALSILWLVTDFAHGKHADREHLRIPHVLGKIDLSGVLFFMGILLCVSSLYTAGLLNALAKFLDAHVSYQTIAGVIGFASAVIDNVPLVAASMGMYSLERFSMDHDFWTLVAYTAGTGGSMLIVGSAAGVVFMGMEKVDFFWYFKKVSMPAAVAFLAGFVVFFIAKVFV